MNIDSSGSESRVNLRRGRLTGCALAALLCIFLTSGEAWGAQTQHLHGHMVPIVQALTPLGELPATNTLRLLIGLPLRNQDKLDRFLTAVQTPGNPQYRQYLTPQQFTDLYGPTEQDYEGVIAFAQSNHLTVVGTHPNRTILDVRGTVADIEQVLHLKLLTYQHPIESRTFRAPDREPTLDLDIPVDHITGLDDYVLPHPLLVMNQRPHGATPRSGSGPSGTYRGPDFRDAYVPGVTLTGTGQSVGLFELDGYVTSDITTYESQAMMPSNVPLQNVLIDGVSGKASRNANAVGEVSLDIEMAISMAPGLSKVLVYEGINNDNTNDPNDVLSRMATDDLAKQLSCSWGFNISSTTEITFKQYQTQGQSFFLASGDSGAYVGVIPQPSDDPNVTVVGATTLTTTGPQGSWVSEKVWNWWSTGQGSAASSGGISTAYSIPSWQAPVSMASNMGSTTMRNIPDVALTGDNVYVIYDGGRTGDFGGTSCAAPLWAAFTALVNEQATNNGQGPVGFLNPALYTIGGGSSYTTDFHDITTGNNTNPSSPSQFYAVTGYDLCTGWGTPNGASMINALAPPGAPVITNSGTALVSQGCLPTNGVINPGETVTVSFGIQDVKGANVVNAVGTLQATGGVTSPSGPRTYGGLTVGGASVSEPFTFTAAGTCGGPLTATLALTQAGTNLGTLNYPFTLGEQVTNPFAQNFDGVTAPALPAGWTTSATGVESNWTTSTAAEDTPPNSAFAPDVANVGLTELVSPVFPVYSSSAQLTFRNNYNLEAISTSGYDGGVLEISIGGGAFQDILTAGGSFVTGGYNMTINTTFGNPLAGRQAWSGNSGGFITTTVNLPASAAGQNVQLRWGCGTDNSNGAPGWYIDSITISDGYYTCCSPNADLAVAETASPNPAVVGRPLTYTLLLTNLGPAAATSVALTDALPAGVSFVSASPGLTQAGGTVTGSIASMASGVSTNFSIVVTPGAQGSLTNSVGVGSALPDPDPTNNSATSVVAADTVPAFTTYPNNVTVALGSNAVFQSAATGTGPLGYQWFFDASALSGDNSNSLTLTDAQPSQAGFYFVIVSNVVGAATSTVATLTVVTPPAVTTQPTNEVVMPGATVSLVSAASGSTPLGYQWYYNGSSLAGATTNTLMLPDVQSSQAGGYYLVVSNLAGTATSSNATIAVLVSPSITSVQMTKTNVSISFASVTGLNYTLEYKDSITNTTWTSILPPVGGTGGSLTLRDPGPAVASRFYRISVQ